ncbi:polyketide synthase [Metarhizium guizhouense ARSEF 977]|uniref:Polyketide synthase n=1 Tax=Metarhizium guizhouense (strain ARSEF 977) TaxID=1276136 RepID=A0A0B4HDU0_METGA|nr:polyketide synthase [Metarhizium guizhouense ARSEF 977]
MLDIGKRDLLATGKLDMNVSLENRDYCCMEISQMGVEKPEMITALLRYNNAILRAGHVQPIWLAQVDAADRIQDASRYMQQGNHIGKMMVNVRRVGSLADWQHQAPINGSSSTAQPGIYW